MRVKYPLVNKNKMLSKVKSTTEIPVIASKQLLLVTVLALCELQKQS